MFCGFKLYNNCKNDDIHISNNYILIESKGLPISIADLANGAHRL